MNPFLPFCVFVATRVFVQHVKRRPNDHDTASSVRFLLSAMTALQAMNPLAASFLIQLDVELEGTGFEAHPDDARHQSRFKKSAVRLASPIELTLVNQDGADSCRRNLKKMKLMDSPYSKTSPLSLRPLISPTRVPFKAIVPLPLRSTHKCQQHRLCQSQRPLAMISTGNLCNINISLSEMWCSPIMGCQHNTNSRQNQIQAPILPRMCPFCPLTK